MASVRTFAKDFFRRKIVRLLGAYIAIFWLLSVGFASLLPALGAPAWVMRAFVAVGLAMIPVLVLFSWKYRIVPPQVTIEDHHDGHHPALGWARVRHDTKDAGFVVLRWHAGDVKGEKRFFQPVTVGRDPLNEVELPDQRVSRYHAVLWAEDGAWHIRDLESANGSFVDGRRVTHSLKLPTTCEIRFHPLGPTMVVTVAKTSETLVG
jgi:hypothetical protein